MLAREAESLASPRLDDIRGRRYDLDRSWSKRSHSKPAPRKLETIYLQHPTVVSSAVATYLERYWYHESTKTGLALLLVLPDVAIHGSGRGCHLITQYPGAIVVLCQGVDADPSIEFAIDRFNCLSVPAHRTRG